MQLDGSDHVEPLRNRLSERTEMQSSKLVLSSYPSALLKKKISFPSEETYHIVQVKATATNVDEAVRELPDANMVSFISSWLLNKDAKV